MRVQKKTILDISRSRQIINALGCLIFMLLGFWLRTVSEGMAWLAILFFGIGFFVFTYQLINRDKYVFADSHELADYINELDITEKEDEGIFYYFNDGFDIEWLTHQWKGVLSFPKKHKIKWVDIEKIVGEKDPNEIQVKGEKNIVSLIIHCYNGFTFWIDKNTRGYYVFIEKLESELKKYDSNFKISNFRRQQSYLLFNKDHTSFTHFKEKF